MNSCTKGPTRTVFSSSLSLSLGLPKKKIKSELKLSPCSGNPYLTLNLLAFRKLDFGVFRRQQEEPLDDPMDWEPTPPPCKNNLAHFYYKIENNPSRFAEMLRMHLHKLKNRDDPMEVDSVVPAGISILPSHA